MRSWFRRGVVPAVVVALFAFVSAAKADTIAVQFSTVGTFTAVPTNGGTISPGNTLSVGNTSLVYNAVTQTVYESDLVGGTATDTGLFGYFTVASSAGSVDLQVYDGAQFQLTVTQEIPDVAPDNTNSFQTQTITGALKYKLTGSTGGGLFLTFAQPLTFTIPASGGDGTVVYRINEDVVIGKGLGGASPGDEFPIGGSVSMPLPKTATVGLSLLASLGALGAWKKFAAGRVLAGV